MKLLYYDKKNELKIPSFLLLSPLYFLKLALLHIHKQESNPGKAMNSFKIISTNAPI